MNIDEYIEPNLYTAVKNRTRQTDDELKVHLEELIKYFLILDSASERSYFPMLFTEEVDAVWHALILETKDYMQLMQKLPNKRFIHHRSSDKSITDRDTNSDSTAEQLVLGFYNSYINNFGPIREEVVHIWPTACQLMLNNEMSISDLNRTLNFDPVQC